MRLHHTKHHQGYVNALKAAEAGYVKAVTPKECIALQAVLKFNGGGHINNSLFWTNLAPSANEGKGAGGVLKGGPLKPAIESNWGSVDAFKKGFKTTTAAIQGYNSKSRALQIVTTANHIVGVDIWGHAFYLQYLNVKANHLNVVWNVINFKEAEKRYKDAVAGSKL
ncbi:manganese superoxide dismutase [Boletus edulis]|nr:manganese superoxide dismutase [Boletus edulis]